MDSSRIHSRKASLKFSADFAEHNLKTLELSGKIESFLHIVECGHEFAKIYDFDDREIVPIREKFEEADELTWR